MYYVLIGIAAIMFSLTFFFNQIYQQNEGKIIDKVLLFSTLVSVVGAAAMVIASKGKLEFSWFSLIAAFLLALDGIGFIYCSSLAFEKVNLSQYSLFSMLGGMILPVISGICFYDEGISLKKLLCIAAIILALFICTDLESKSKALIFCLEVFILNGMSGVISKWHQSGTSAVSSSSFLFFKCIITIVICLLILIPRLHNTRLNNPLKSVSASIGYGLMTNIANFFILIALLHVKASVQYPMITGGTIAVSLIISIINREKITYKNVLSAIFAFIATLLIIE